MATNTNDDHRDGSVKDRIQVCDVKTGICKKIDTSTNKVIGEKKGSWKGVADHTDKRKNDDFNSEIDSKF